MRTVCSARRSGILAACSAILTASLISICAAQAPAGQAPAIVPPPPNLAGIGIKNFGCVSSNYYRGAQPEGHDYADLAKIGVKSVIDLERTGDSSEEQSVESAGMKFYRLNLSDRSLPEMENVTAFLKIVNDPANLPVYVHCHGGKHRTGAMTAVYRISHDGWTADRAFEEMKAYQFEHGFGHGVLKQFVYDYYSKNKPSKDAQPAVVQAAAVSTNKGAA